MKSTPLLLICGALSLFAAGCGGDDEDSGSTTSTPAESAARGYDETISAVNDICDRANAEIDPVGTKITGKAGEADAELIGQIVEINDKYIAELGAIEPDPKLATAFDDFAAKIDQQQSATRETQEAAASGDQEAYEAALGQIGLADQAKDAAARTLGATACAKNP